MTVVESITQRSVGMRSNSLASAMKPVSIAPRPSPRAPAPVTTIAVDAAACGGIATATMTRQSSRLGTASAITTSGNPRSVPHKKPRTPPTNRPRLNTAIRLAFFGPSNT